MAKSYVEMARQAVRRGRPKQQSLEEVIDVVAGEGGEDVEDEAKEAQQAVEAVSVPAVIEHEQQLIPYQDGLPFDLERVKYRILDNYRTVAESYLSIGRYLVWVKQELKHGEFKPWVEKEMPFTYKQAWGFMVVTRRVLSAKSSNVGTFLGVTAGDSTVKLLMLATEVDDEEVDEAMESGEFLGKPIDEVQNMSVRQLKGALREEKDRNQVLRDKLEAKERKLSKAQADLDRARNPEETETDTPPTILERHLAALVKRFGETERVAAEFAEEFGDEGLVEQDIREMVGSFIGTLNQKCTHLYQILVPDQIRDQRWHIAEQAKTDEDAA